MQGWASILQACASLLWPILALLLLLRFGPVVKAIVESARFRKLTLKIGGQELTLEEANQQQGALIADLQAQVLALRQSLAPGSETARLEPANVPEAVVEHRRAVLWVDDQPRNNSYLIQEITNRGGTVDLASSTEEGVEKFQAGAYTLVISDMGRKEGRSFREDAGLTLLQKIRAIDKEVPFIIFCSYQKARRYKREAIKLGATAITASPTDLIGLLS